MNQSSDSFYFGNSVYDLRLIAFGHRQCEAGYYRPIEINTDFYVIHYIASGKVTFFKGDTAYPLQAGQCFLSRPGDIFRFHADLGEPFHYVWLRFTGQSARRIDRLPYTLDLDGTVFWNLIQCDTQASNVEEYSTAMLYLLFSQLHGTLKKENDYVAIVKNYIRTHHSGAVTVAQLQKLVNLNRQYLSTLFKQSTGITLQQYILQTRMEKAKLLLSQGYSVSQAADLCGYANIYAFSKSFKKAAGTTPSGYQKHASDPTGQS